MIILRFFAFALLNIRAIETISGVGIINVKTDYGEYDLSCGVIVSQCHLHASKEQAAWYGLKDGDSICVRKRGVRTIVFENVLVRAGDTHSLELHFDTDEANAALINNDDLLELVRSWEI